MKILSKPNRILSLLLALSLVLPFLNVGSAQAEVISSNSASSASSHYDYFKDVYTNLKNVDTHVFKTITFEDLVTISKSKGTFALLIGGAWSDETQADIGYINEVAKANGVKEIYNFDTRLDGVNPNLDIALTHPPLTATATATKQNVTTTTTTYFDYTEYYVELIKQNFTNLSTLSTVPASYQNLSKKEVNAATQVETTASTVVASGSAKSVQSPYLLIYNKDNKVDGVSTPVVAYLEKHGTNDSYTWDSYFKNNAGHVTDYKAQVKAVFDQAAAAGYAPSAFDTVTSWDLIGPAFNKNRASGTIEIFPSKTVDGKIVPDTGTNGIYEQDASLVFEHVTYHELTKLLATQGNYAFLFGGSWCPNTQAEIRWINRYAKAHNIDKIYFYDTRLDAGVGVTLRTPSYNQHDQGTTLQTRDNETANPLAYLYGNLANTYLTNILTTYTLTQGIKYTENGAGGTQKTAYKLQVPYLFTYNKDNKDANGASAPILGHVEVMNTWGNTFKGPFYNTAPYTDASPQAQYAKYEIAANDLFTRFSRVETTPSGLIGVAPTVSDSVYGQITGVAGRNLEYRKSGGTVFTAVYEETITKLVPGTYQVRFQSNGYNTNYNPTVKPATGTVTYNLDRFIEVVVPAYVAPSNGNNNGSTPSTPTTPVDTGVVKTPVTGNTDKVTFNVPSKTDPATGDTLATVGKDAVTSLVDNAKKSEAAGKSAVVELKVEATEQTKTAQLTIPRTSFNEVATGTKADVKVDYGNVGTVSFDAKAVSTINSVTATGDISIIISKTDLTAEGKELLGDRPVYDFSVFAGESKVSSFGGGNVHISLPYVLKAGESAESVIVYYINDAGELLTVHGQFNSATGTVDFTTTHFSQYVIGYNKVSFADVQSSAWYNKAVSYLAARDITSGTDDTHFSPDQALTRGQFIVLLLKAYGIDAAASGSTANFTDAGNTYYSNYLAAAKNLGIATGTGDNQFSPDKIITREDLFTLLYRSLEKLGQLPVEKTGASVTDFKDAGHISDYAHTAIHTFVESGIIAGSNDQLDPQGVATRAQVAQVLYNLLSK